MRSPIEVHLARLRAELRNRGVVDERIADEAHAHLVDAAERGVKSGLSREDAELRATAEFGAPELVADQFASQRFRTRNRLVARLLRFITFRSTWLPSAQDSGFHDKPSFCLARRTRRGWVDPELLEIASDPDTRLVPYLERTAPRPLGTLGRLESLTLVEESASRRTYRAIFGGDTPVVCTVVLAPDGRALNVGWSRPANPARRT